MLSSSPSTSQISINNIWDCDEHFIALKGKLLQDTNGDRLEDYERIGKSLLSSSDPYQIKLGIHILRLCIWHDERLAKEWVVNIAPKLLQHSHARVRQSTLWNIRCSIWQDTSLTTQAFNYAGAGLTDSDPAIQRVSIWLHGDCLVNNPDLFEVGINSIRGFLISNPKEANYIFALERFYNPNRHLFRSKGDYYRVLSDIMQENDGRPGVKARCLLAMNETFTISERERDAAIQMMFPHIQGNAFEENFVAGRFEEIVKSLICQFDDESNPANRVRTIWMIRSILWISGYGDRDMYRTLAASMRDVRDGDLLRTTMMVLGDFVMQNPKDLAVYGIQDTIELYNATDVDGSQIVAAQTFLPLSGLSREADMLLHDKLPDLLARASNRSVIRAIQHLISQKVD